MRDDDELDSPILLYQQAVGLLEAVRQSCPPHHFVRKPCLVPPPINRHGIIRMTTTKVPEAGRNPVQAGTALS